MWRAIRLKIETMKPTVDFAIDDFRLRQRELRLDKRLANWS
jgi:hypothetical protein